MRQWSINIEGNYLDSFLYMGLLFLCDFDGNINVYHFEKILKERFKRENKTKKQEFSQIFLKKYQNSRYSIQHHQRIENHQKIEINFKFMQQFKTDCLEIGEWITDINVTSKNIYFSSVLGLQKRAFCVDSKSKHYGTFRPNQKIMDLFLDTKVYSFTNSAKRTVLCCGDEGAIYFVEQNDNRLKYIKDDKTDEWIDCQWYSLLKNDVLSINSEFNITHQKLKLKESLSEILKRIGDNEKVVKERSYTTSLKEERLNKLKQLRLSALNEKLPECFKDDLNRSEIQIDKMEVLKIRELREKAIFSQISDNQIICDINNEKRHIRIDGEITNWRIFPNARTHFNQLHVIYDDYMTINGFELAYQE